MRDASTYRQSRRNRCKEEKGTWNSKWYYENHKAPRRLPRHSSRPKVSPAAPTPIAAAGPAGFRRL
jgi:hypothetical protein